MFDDLQNVLLFLLIAITGLQLTVFRDPEPLLHPILLGRQAHPSKTRRRYESAVWTHASYIQGFGQLAARPVGWLKTVKDLLERAPPSALLDDAKSARPASEQAQTVQVARDSEAITLENNAEFTQMNMTAGLHALISSLPGYATLPRSAAGLPASSGPIVTSMSPKSTYGCALVLLALASGDALVRVQSMDDLYGNLFVEPATLAPTLAKLRAQVNHSSIVKLAVNRKMALAKQGLLTRTSSWDRLYLSSFRRLNRVDRLRSIVLVCTSSDRVKQTDLTFLRALLGCPVMLSLTHPNVFGPVATMHYYDLQDFPFDANDAPTGVQASNIEIQLTDVADTDADEAEVMRGKLRLRGPAVAPKAMQNGWSETDIHAEIRTNGTLKVIHAL
ncbi:uncharacterized protein L969DRAFT_96058 [Mixia osmundae IAM 14324]|uniref:Uncharacterized protein n=1 Tax=Mixia osmundae (strain CBS 9802 / IAM 14324 / JCM 22182 / KY 12970) TaxID=764103 RepID=G7DS56_MIXOS|nr:uncharacterized protein L969DRAFT_96058 [Mixia osmundae IAM 14324]KEI37530.1 hypothetical protein L969DRAFT_96058 [Mixia osmundae IAM 14324]GAA93416.1 hypothetical protein E5Q_00057 [Mixia osmundae IAM 14324]